MQIQNFMKIRPVRAEFHAGGQRDITKLMVAFRNFANAPNKTNLNYVLKSLPYLPETYWTFLKK
jgi:hypothetical protein